MRLFVRTRATAVLMLFSSVLVAKKALAEPAPLTLNALLDSLSRQSPELRMKEAQVRAALERPAQARALEDPSFSVELWQAPLSGERLPLMFTLRQPLPWPGKLGTRAASVVPLAARARAEALASGRTLRLLGTRAYFSYRLALRAIGILRDDEKLLRTVLAAVDSRYRVGRAELSELFLTREKLANLDNQILDLEQERDGAITAINVLLAQPTDTPLGFPISEPELRALPPLPALIEQAKKNRPELAIAASRIDEFRAKIAAAKMERAPDLALWASYMTMLRGDAARESTFTVGLSSTIPSLSLSGRGAVAREAMAELSAAEAELAKIESEIAGEVRAASLQLGTARRHIELHRSTLIPLSEQSAAAARASYQTGRGNLVSLFEATRMLIEHHLEYERFFADYGQRLAELSAAVCGSATCTLGTP